MNTRKILTNGLLIGIIIVIIACVPDGFERVASWFFPPRLYIAIAAVIIVILLKILFELRNRNNGNGDGQ